MEEVAASELAKIYMELGVLGLIAVVMIIILITVIKATLENNNSNRTLLAEILKKEQKQNTEIIEEIINKIVTHVPSKVENDQLTEMQKVINKELKDLLVEVNASRVALIQYHNGGRSANKQSFLKMSCTNEQFRIEEEPLMTELKDQFRALFSEAIDKIDKNGFFYVEHLNDIKNVDNGMYRFMEDRGDEQAFHYAIHNQEKMVIGFLLIIYSSRTEVRKTSSEIEPYIKSVAKILENLLNLK